MLDPGYPEAGWLRQMERTMVVMVVLVGIVAALFVVSLAGAAAVEEPRAPDLERAEWPPG